MKTILLSMALLAMTASAAVTPATLPAPVGGTLPPQGLVNVGPNTYSRGVSDISLVFPGTHPELNEDCNEPHLLYKDDFGTPIEISHAASVGMTDFTINEGVVSFVNRVYREDGLYKVVIPAGRFLVDDEETPEVTLYYEIHNGYVAEPRPGVVEWLDDIAVTFPNAVKVELNQAKGAGMEFFKVGSTNTYEIVPNVLDRHGVGYENTVAFTFGSSDGIAQRFIEPGEFSLIIPEGYISYWEPGVNFDNDPEDLVAYSNFEIRLRYFVPSSPQPEIIPAQGTLDKFTDFQINVDEEFTVWFVDDKAGVYIYPAFESGEVDANSPLYLTKIDMASRQGNSFKLKFYEYDPETGEDGWLPELKPQPGKYALRLSRGLYTGMFNGNFVNSDPFDYFYEIAGGINEVDAPEVAAPEKVNIFNLQGVCVARNAEAASALESLPKGIYVVGGKKVAK